MKKKICENLNSKIRGLIAMRDCRIYSCVVRELPLLIDKRYDYTLLSYDDIQNKRKALYEAINSNNAPQCEDCNLLYEDDEQNIEIGKLSTLIYHPFTTCNQRCCYCFFTHEELSAKLDSKTADLYAAIEHFTNIGLLKDDISFEIGGGEPLLFNHLKEGIELLAQRCPNAELAITSNYTLDEKVKELEEILQNRKIRTWLKTSLDCGTKETYKKLKERDLWQNVTNNILSSAEKGIYDNIFLKYILLEDNSNNSPEDINGFCEFCKKVVKVNKHKTSIIIDADVTTLVNDEKAYFKKGDNTLYNVYNYKPITEEMLNTAVQIYIYATKVLGVEVIWHGDRLSVHSKQGVKDVNRIIEASNKIMSEIEGKHAGSAPLYNKCSGCGACSNVCPVKAIEMIKNAEGFLYPKIDLNKCIWCKLCHNVCPINNFDKSLNNIQDQTLFAAFQKDNEERVKSTSGSIAAALAKQVISEGGYFCGAAFDKGLLKHQIINDYKDFEKMRGSKHFQSQTFECFPKIKELLKDNKKVVFVGTPCQVSGLKLFLKDDYKNLYTADLICHGVTPQKAYEEFAKANGLEEALKEANCRIFKGKNALDNDGNIHFTGWHNCNLSIEVDNQLIYSKSIFEDTYGKAFLHNLALRDVCGECSFRKAERPGDLTIGDFWEIENIDKSMDSTLGTSVIFANNKKGQKLFKEISKDLEYKEYTPETYQWMLRSKQKHHINRAKFFEKLGIEDFNQLTERLLDKKNNVALFNFRSCNNNFGCVITSLALNKVVNILGYNAYNIDFSSNCADTSNFEEFREKYIPKTYYCESDEDYNSLNNFFGTFIVGSDTVFFYDNIPWSKLYLDFVSRENKKIAYAASFFAPSFKGSDDITPQVGFWLSRFNDISVREKSGVSLLNKTFHISDGKHVLDPVFLLDKSFWQSLIPENTKDFSNQKVLYSVNYKELSDKFPEIECINTVKVEEWISAMINSPFVITDSFHGACFRIMFNKPFICIGKDNDFAHRIASLLEMFDLPKELVTIGGNEEKIKNIIENPINIDYSHYPEKLEKYKKESMQFLIDALNKENAQSYDPYYLNIVKLSNKINEQTGELNQMQTIIQEKLNQQTSELKQMQTIIQENLNKPTFIQQIFSLRNEENHKVLRILGIKIKKKRVVK